MLSQGRPSDGSRTAWLLAAMSAAFVVSYLTYRGMLAYFFTGTDTLTLIETSRVNHFGDLVRLLTEPLMAGTSFVDVAKFYRPLTAFSYSLDYAVWHLYPWGFQLTNLLLNAFVASLVVLVLYELSERDVAFACVGGILFAIHPILVESVPATDRRQDMLAAVFLLLALVLFIKYRTSRTKKRLLISCSLASYALALAAKEIGVIALPLMFAHVFLFSEARGYREKCHESCRRVFPFAVVTGLYLAWRTIVLGGIGGYLGNDPLPFQEGVTYAVNVLYNYATDLLYPADVLGFEENAMADWWAGLMVALAAGYVSLCVWRSKKWYATCDSAPCTALVQFLLIWLALPLLVFIATLTFAHRSMYIPAIPFSALIAYPATQSYRSLVSLMSARRSLWSFCVHSFLTRPSRMLVSVASAVFFMYVLTYSPLVRTYGHWHDSARIASQVLTQLTAEVHGISPDYRIEVYDLPDRIRSYEKEIPRAREVNYLQDYSIQSWLNMLYPKRAATVVVRSRSWPQEFSGNLRVGLVRLSQRNLVAFVEMLAKPKPRSVARR